MASTKGSQGLASPQQVAELIDAGRVLSVAGDESLLKQLPKGNWIGGTIPYFMGEQGGEVTREKLYVNDLTAICHDCEIRTYGLPDLPNLVSEAPENGFSLIILPGGSEILSHYAKNAPDYEDIFLKPIVGWVSGHHLGDSGPLTPGVINGLEGRLHDNNAVALQISLPPDRFAQLDIVNLFQQGDGPSFRFSHSGFTADACLIDGNPHNLAEYLSRQEIDTRLPLVADYSGALVNVSIREVDLETGCVTFYAPVFSGIDYRLAAPVSDYVTDFMAAIPSANEQWLFSCNCILNYLYMGLEGKRTANITGPFTFGEIAYQLLNQTLVYLSVEEL